METLTLERPLTVKEPEVLLDPQLPEGTYLVRLVVQGSTGKSEPAELVIKVSKE
ncbi:MAG TPA: hypothetical protein VFM98_17820 [Ramlibacter sp.]|uniref:hypothetical protein n=1 Tax=Ramlibacter sp. TaxID=1917967 RepID=UPI002D7F0682|nr:hypothetical protein [Ramlibacter sp.]HET8747463.1 hypothetical protein [Ramlibacter sp.]